MDPIRRKYCQTGLRTMLAMTLLQHAVRADALEGTLRWVARPWLQQLHEVSAALTAGIVKPQGWQAEVQRILGRVDLDDLRRSLDFDRLAAAARYPSQGEGMERLYFPDAEGRLHPLGFRPYLFSLRQGVAVVPHGHHNMATLHLMLSGEARVRHYDRLETTPTHLVIRGTSDRTARPGDVSSISDERDNVHWFQAQSERVLMFNIGVIAVQADAPSGDRDYVDPLGGVDAGSGALRVPRLDRAAAYAKYGRTG